MTSLPEKEQVFTYNLKIINSAKKSVFSIKPLLYKLRFTSLNDLKKCVKDETSEIKGDVIGYIEPGHGQKGKLRTLCTDEDLSEMYVLHRRKHEVLLWCYGSVGEQTQQSAMPRKRTTDGSAPPSAKRHAIEKNITEIETIIKRLKEKHGDSYSVEKLNCWAHMLNMGKHSSYDEPPDFPFFKKPKDKIKNAVATSADAATSSVATTIAVTTAATVAANSPTKRVGLRAQCIDQLSKWHALLTAGAIDQSQYEDLKETILGDIKKM